MTLSETLIAAGVLAVALTIVALGAATVRTELKRRQVWELLGTLDEALSAYHEVAHEWPADPAARDTGPAVRDAEDGSGDRIIAVLVAVPASMRVLEQIPEVLRVKSADQPWGTVQDAWGRRLRCLTSQSGEVDRQAVVANGGRPIFISAGPDGGFGIQDVAAAGDNLRSSDAR